MGTKSYKFYSDSSHGWVAVTRKELEKLGIINKVSGYSYISPSGKTIYLEEDCDATLFVKAKQAKNEVIAFIDKYIDGRHWIRNLSNFSL